MKIKYKEEGERIVASTVLPHYYGERNVVVQGCGITKEAALEDLCILLAHDVVESEQLYDKLYDKVKKATNEFVDILGGGI